MHCPWYVSIPSTAESEVPRPRYIGYSPALSTVRPKKERAENAPACCFHSRIAHIPDRTSPPPPPRARTRVLLKQSRPRPRSGPVLSSCFVLPCPVIVRLHSGFPHCDLVSVFFLFSPIHLTDLTTTRTATGLYQHITTNNYLRNPPSILTARYYPWLFACTLAATSSYPASYPNVALSAHTSHRRPTKHQPMPAGLPHIHFYRS